MCTMNEFFLINFTVIDSVSLFMNASPHSYTHPKRHIYLYPIYNCSIFGNHLKKSLFGGGPLRKMDTNRDGPYQNSKSSYHQPQHPPRY